LCEVSFNQTHPNQNNGNSKHARGSDSLLILSLYNVLICLVAALLYVAVNKLEPNYRQASALKVLIVTLALVAILAHSMQ